MELLPDLELEGVASEKSRRRQPVQRRGGGNDDNIGASVLVALLDSPQRGQTLADQVLMRRKGVVRQGLPVGEKRTAQVGRKKRDLVHQALRRAGVRRDDGGEFSGCFFALPELGQQQGVGGTDRLEQGVAFAGLKLGKVHKPDFRIYD